MVSDGIPRARGLYIGQLICYNLAFPQLKYLTICSMTCGSFNLQRSSKTIKKIASRSARLISLVVIGMVDAKGLEMIGTIRTLGHLAIGDGPLRFFEISHITHLLLIFASLTNLKTVHLSKSIGI